MWCSSSAASRVFRLRATARSEPPTAKCASSTSRRLGASTPTTPPTPTPSSARPAARHAHLPSSC
eukprot:1918630-Prymnesium_polylepis.1